MWTKHLRWMQVRTGGNLTGITSELLMKLKRNLRFEGDVTFLPVDNFIVSGCTDVHAHLNDRIYLNFISACDEISSARTCTGIPDSCIHVGEGSGSSSGSSMWEFLSTTLRSNPSSNPTYLPIYLPLTAHLSPSNRSGSLFTYDSRCPRHFIHHSICRKMYVMKYLPFFPFFVSWQLLRYL